MHRKIRKIVSVMFIIIYIVSFTTIVLGEEIDPISVIGSGPNPTSGGVDTLYNLGNIILGIIQYIAVGVAIIATLILAIRYMYNSPDEKAEIKKKLIPYIIGSILTLGAVQLVKLVEIFANEIT